MFSSIFISQWLLPWRADFLSQIRFLKFSRLVIDISRLSCDDLHCSNFRWPDRELRCLYQDIPWPIFIIFEVLMDETTQWGILQWSFSDFLSPNATWTYLRVKLFNQLKQAWLTMIQSYIDHSCKYQLLCAIMITLCYHPRTDVWDLLWIMQSFCVCM